MASSIIKILEERATSNPGQILYTFLTDGEENKSHIKYRDLFSKAAAIGSTLQNIGKGGERALLLYPPGVEYIFGFFGSLLGNFIAVPAYPPDPFRMNITLPKLQSIINDSTPSVILTTSVVKDLAQELFPVSKELRKIKWVTTDDLSNDISEEWQFPRIESDTLALLQYTSGSTSSPKGVMVTHGNLINNSEHIYSLFGHSSESIAVIWLPPYHDMGLIGGIIQPLFGNFHMVLMSPFDFIKKPYRWLRAISDYKATTSGGPNFAYDLATRKVSLTERETLDLSSWKVAFNGAEPIRKETIDRFTEYFKPCGFSKKTFYPCYGLAESTLIVTGGKITKPPLFFQVNNFALENNIIEPEEHETNNSRYLVGCGQILRDHQILIVDPTSLIICPPDQVGEIWVSGSSVAKGYWNSQQDTTYSFQACLIDVERGPFLRTGDFGFIRNNELFIVGRMKDLIIIHGKNHHPQDIEKTVENCHKSLRPGCGAAFSVDVNNKEHLVILQEIRSQTLDSKYDEIIELIEQAIIREHGITAYAVLLIKERSIPKTSSGKIQRFLCKAGFQKNKLSIISQKINNPDLLADIFIDEGSNLHETITAIKDLSERSNVLTLYLQWKIAQLLRMPPTQIDINKPINSFGFDSLMLLELTHELETALGLEISDYDFIPEISISQLASSRISDLITIDSPASIQISSSREETEIHQIPLFHKIMRSIYRLLPERDTSDLQKELENKKKDFILQRKDWVIKGLAPMAKIIPMYHTIRIEGEENLPHRGPAFLAVKHCASRDTFLFGHVLHLLTKRYGNYIMMAQPFKIFNVILEKLGGIRVIRPRDILRMKNAETRRDYIKLANEANRISLDYISWLYQIGELIVFYPEGLMYPKSMGILKTGIINHILQFSHENNTQVSVIPIGINYKSYIKPKSEVNFRIGKPLYVDTNTNQDELIKILNQKVSELSGYL